MVVPAWADWNLGDPYKMQTPQLPGMWDISWTTRYLTGVGWLREPLADDWRCSQSGAVSDIHFWYSWRGDLPLGAHIDRIGVQIRADDNSSGGFKKPGTTLWSTIVYPGQFTTRQYGTWEQGFYFPAWDYQGWYPDDHQKVYQINIENISNPFYQSAGTVYWLQLTAWTSPDAGPPPEPPPYPPPGDPNIGWKTSGAGVLSNAVYMNNGAWYKLPNPETMTYPQDLAFVITPEPTTMSLLALGGLALLRRRRA